MAVEIHTVDLKLVWIGPGDKILEKDNPNTKLMDFTKGSVSQERRVVPKLSGAGASANSDGYPTVDEYLQLEAGDDFAFAYMDQTILITQKIT